MLEQQKEIERQQAAIKAKELEIARIQQAAARNQASANIKQQIKQSEEDEDEEEEQSAAGVDSDNDQ